MVYETHFLHFFKKGFQKEGFGCLKKEQEAPKGAKLRKETGNIKLIGTKFWHKNPQNPNLCSAKMALQEGVQFLTLQGVQFLSL